MQVWGIPKIFFIYFFVIFTTSLGGLRADQRVSDQVHQPETPCPKKIMTLAENPVYQGLHEVIPDMAGSFGKTKVFKYGVQPIIESAMGLKGLANLYAEAIQMDPQIPFSDRMLKTVNISHSVNNGGLNSIPKTGSLLLVSNHPFGIADGLLLLNLVRKARLAPGFSGADLSLSALV